MAILITSCVWVTLFTLLNQIAQRSQLIVQAQRDDLLAALEELLDQALSREPMVLDEVARAWRTARIAADKAGSGGAK